MKSEILIGKIEQSTSRTLAKKEKFLIEE